MLCLYARQVTPMRVLKAYGGVLVLSFWSTVLPHVSAEVFVCVQPGGLEVYRDYGGPGCRIIEEKPARPKPPTQALTTPAAPQGQIEMPSLPPAAQEQTAHPQEPAAQSKPTPSRKPFRVGQDVSACDRVLRCPREQLVCPQSRRGDI